MPGSMTIIDSNLSGSGGPVKVTLKDDGQGNIYRADSYTSASQWNSVGNIYYDEGLVLIKNPHLYFYGKEGYEMSFKGEQSLHTLRIDAFAPANHLNSSSNPNFKAIKPSSHDNDVDEFVYITGINFHDDNYNVVMKAQLSQPVIKRHHDRLMFKIRYDM